MTKNSQVVTNSATASTEFIPTTKSADPISKEKVEF